MRLSFAPALALCLAPVVSAQILDPSGVPDPTFAGFYAWYEATGANFGMVTGGAPVTSWVDATGNGRDLVRVSSDPARHAVYDPAGALGLPSVEFDGDDYIWGDRTAEFGTLAGAKTVFVVARVDLADGGYVFDSSSSVGRNALFAGQSTAPMQWQLYAGAGTPGPGPQVTAGAWNVHTGVFATAAQEHYIDGNLASIGTETTADLAGLVLGARYTVSNGLTGGIAEVLVYEGVVSPTDRDAVEGYLRGKYGIGSLGTSTMCAASPNSTGSTAEIGAVGNAAAAANDVTLSCQGLPTNSFGYFLTSTTSSFTMNPGGSQGNLCLGGAIGRYALNVLNSGASDRVTLALDLTATPTPTGTVATMAGDTRYYQYWFRDANPTVTSNFSTSLEITFQ